MSSFHLHVISSLCQPFPRSPFFYAVASFMSLFPMSSLLHALSLSCHPIFVSSFHRSAIPCLAQVIFHSCAPSLHPATRFSYHVFIRLLLPYLILHPQYHPFSTQPILQRSVLPPFSISCPPQCTLSPCSCLHLPVSLLLSLLSFLPQHDLGLAAALGLESFFEW